ncbi:MAG: UPF0182 family protein [Syntrophobacterales bacterium]|nr:UPF0182 family protein [Syntrophobacterales bacterium]
MLQWIKDKVVAILFTLAIVVAAYFGFYFFFKDFIIDSWWFDSLGYGKYFWQRATYSYVIFSSATVLFFIIFFMNFWITSRVLTKPEESQTGEESEKRRIRQLIENFRYGSLRVYAPLAMILAVLLAYPLFVEWEKVLLFIFSTPSGIKDPTFSKDISFYLFSLPFYKLIEKRFAIIFIIITVATFILYTLEIRLIRRTFNRFSFPKPVRWHLSILLVGLAAIAIWHLMIIRYELVYTNTHTAFYGPGFVEMNVRLPLIWLTITSIFLGSLSLVIFFNFGKGLKFLIALIAISLASYALMKSNLVTERVQKYIVKPNELSKELPYIERSIRATLQAYNLQDVEIREYHPEEGEILKKSEELKNVLRNIPVWDRELLHDVYKQLQGLRPYYEFTGVDVDRYTLGSFPQQVFISARELSIDKLPESAKNWVNLHMKYTHGHGIVMTPAIQGGEEPITWFIKDLPPRSSYGFTLSKFSIYYGQANYTYAIVPNKLGEVGYPQGETVTTENYQGTGGIPLSSFLRKAMFAIAFKDRNIFFTTGTSKDSRMMFRRNIVEIVQKLTPYLALDKDPYVVLAKGRLFWIQDAYTFSNLYPNSEPFSPNINYIRNSVKIVIDAYDGSVEYYVTDLKDPIIQTYRKAYPGFFKDISGMSEELRAHLRYPQDIFEIQMSIFTRYHQRKPESFYKQDDAWRFARVFQNGAEKIIRPYYLTLNIFNPDKAEFLLIQPFSPRGLDLLRAIATVSSDGDRYGKITVLAFPKETQVYGPSQVNAIIDQDTSISQQFTLWNQIGSAVERGNIIILPYAGSVLYIQPVYLKATGGVTIPELKRLIIAYEDMVVMEPSLEASLEQLIKRIEIREKLYKERLKRFSGE